MRKKHPEHVNLERWLVSYADFITLLFAFFVVMYAISQADMAKFKAAAQSLHQAFSPSGPTAMIDLGGSPGGGATVNPFDPRGRDSGRLLDFPAGKTNTATDPDPDLQSMKERLEESISLELGTADLSDRLQMLFDRRGLIVRLAVKDFFAEDEAQVRSDLLPVLDRIGRVLALTPRLIRIEGHSDPSEAKPRAYPSDWELSAARAAWVAKYWLRRFDLDPARIEVAGLAHYRPLTDKTNPWARGKNRRVEIIILNNRFARP